MAIPPTTAMVAAVHADESVTVVTIISKRILKYVTTALLPRAGTATQTAPVQESPPTVVMESSVPKKKSVTMDLPMHVAAAMQRVTDPVLATLVVTATGVPSMKHVTMAEPTRVGRAMRTAPGLAQDRSAATEFGAQRQRSVMTVIQSDAQGPALPIAHG